MSWIQNPSLLVARFHGHTAEALTTALDNLGSVPSGKAPPRISLVPSDRESHLPSGVIPSALACAYVG